MISTKENMITKIYEINIVFRLTNIVGPLEAAPPKSSRSSVEPFFASFSSALFFSSLSSSMAIRVPV